MTIEAPKRPVRDPGGRPSLEPRLPREVGARRSLHPRGPLRPELNGDLGLHIYPGTERDKLVAFELLLSHKMLTPVEIGGGGSDRPQSHFPWRC